MSRDIERKEHYMDTFEMVEYDYEETWGSETDSTSQFGIALAAVVAGNLICWSAKKAYESIRKNNLKKMLYDNHKVYKKSSFSIFFFFLGEVLHNSSFLAIISTESCSKSSQGMLI